MSYLDSNRKGHVAAAAATGVVVMGYSVYSGAPPIGITALTIFAWELYATPDMDHSSRRVWGSIWRKLWVLYWYPYAQCISHRSRWSHSLLFGLPLRLLYGLAPFWFWVGYQWWYVGTIPRVLELFPFVLTGCVLADIVHLVKDGYGPVKVLLGR